MLGPLILLLAIAIALWAVAAGRRGAPLRVGRVLATFALAALALRALLLVAVETRAAGLRGLALALAAAAGLACWAALARLAASLPRRRDLFLRLPFAVLATLFALSSSSLGASALSAALAALAYRWRTCLPTLRLFWLALGASALVLALGWGVPADLGLVAAAGALAPLAMLAQWARRVALAYALIAAPVLLRAMLRDPTLGIRTVGRRLALSHVLVVAVPLALLVGLWAFTTVLGVNSERALVGARAVEAEGHQLGSALQAALARPEGADAALRALAGASADRWPRLRVWRVDGGGVARVAGAPLVGESALAGWVAGLDHLPGSGLVAIGSGHFLGAAVRDPRSSAIAAIALAPAESVLVRNPGRIAGARLHVEGNTLSMSGGALTVGRGEPATAGAAAPPRAASEWEDLADSVRADARSGDGSDSSRLERALGVTRRLGVPDSQVHLQAASRPRTHLRVTAGRDTFESMSGDSSAVPFLFQGHALVNGLGGGAWGWSAEHFLLSASSSPGEVLGGIYRNTQSDVFGYLPLVVVLLLSLTALLVGLFDVAMVTGMGRSITAAIDALKRGARRLETGDLAHRIAVTGDDDLWEVAATFNQASAGLERARALEQEALRLESELALARRIQGRLLPAGPPQVDGLEIAGVSEPAREVGGDYFDHIPLGDGRVLLVIADVSGKGVGAALLMSGFRASLISQDCEHTPPDALAGRLNEFLHRSVDPGKFVTAFVAFLDGRDGRLVYANAGHNPPVLLRRDGAHELLTTGGLILGILPGSRFESGEATLAPGDLVALYTDGVTEGADATGEQWGEERLLAALRARASEPCAALVRGIVHEVRAFEGESGPADDITLLVARRT